MPHNPLYLQIYHDLKKKIIAEHWTELPSEKELVDNYKVSRVTLRNALKLLKKEGVISPHAGRKTPVNSEVLLQKFQSNSANTAPQKIIGFVIADFSDSWGAQLLKNIQFLAAQFGYQLIVNFSRESAQLEAENIKNLIKLNVAGILVFPVESEIKNREILYTDLCQIPIVVIDRQLNDYDLPFVATNNYHVSYTITKKLLQLGHKDILFLMQSNAKNTAIQDRIAGIHQAYADTEILLHDYQWLRLKFPFTRGYEARNLLNREVKKVHNHIQKIARFSCFMALDFASANILAVTLQPMPNHVKDKCSFLSFDGISYTTFVLKSDFIIQDEALIAKTALELLIAQINGVPQKSKILLDAKYIDNFAVKQNTFQHFGARF